MVVIGVQICSCSMVVIVTILFSLIDSGETYERGSFNENGYNSWSRNEVLLLVEENRQKVINWARLTFACSNSTTETLEKGMKYVQN